MEKDVSYAQARILYKEAHQPRVGRTYATVVNTQNDNQTHDTTLSDRVAKLETKMDKMMSVLDNLLAIQAIHSFIFLALMHIVHAS